VRSTTKLRTFARMAHNGDVTRLGAAAAVATAAIIVSIGLAGQVGRVDRAELGRAPGFVECYGFTVPAARSRGCHGLGHPRSDEHGSDTGASVVNPESPNLVPAQMLTGGTAQNDPFSGSLLSVTNGWTTGDETTLVDVYAGVVPGEPTDGRLIIFRQVEASASQTLDEVTLPGAGGLRIVRAPLGSAVEASAQRGRIWFKTASGRSGFLDLRTDRATLTPAE
jgi:hypothetical protein